jgi:DNA-binding NtrC family response regulator
LGDQSERTVDTRVICATNRDLEHELRAGNFRTDLFYRINVFRLRMPSLRERREDIPLIAEFFREHHEKQFAKKSERFPAEMLEYLQNLNWNGNVRELSNGIARYVLIGPEAAMVAEQPQRRGAMATGEPGESNLVPLKRRAKDAIKAMERNVILESLRENKWNRRKTAQALKISYRALIYKIRDAGLVSRKAAVQAVSPEIAPRARGASPS